MPLVRPLPGISYALDRHAARPLPERVRLPDEPEPGPSVRIADVTDLVCPPYDVISPELQRRLLERHPRNAVRLELSAEADPHAAAARTLDQWLADGTLERRAEPSVYYYAHATPDDPDQPSVAGVLARVLLEPFGREVRPHEHTMPGPKADRLALLRATRTQLSPILAVYFDRSERYRHVMSRAWADEWRARDEDGLLHTLAAVEPDERLLGFLSRQTLFIADGHHRYETALAHQAEVRSDPRRADAPEGSLGADWIMMVLVNAEVEQLQILPTHRLIRRADPERLRELVTDGGPMWQALPVAPGDLAGRLEAMREAEEPVFGVLLPGGEGWLLVGDADAVADRMRRERMSTAVQRLDLAILHTAILADRLGIDADAVAAGQALTYTRSEAEARAAVAGGEAVAAFLVRPTPLEQMARVANAGDVMPQKSTYFYPKLLTGMVFNPLED
ncbi:MAG TPA: DUF1015 domain-containing protein [candidate division Zixibacteria bacterium]|nr:DUF1015 domain-containing protein [candidate division Zixibacteria bacterium]